MRLKTSAWTLEGDPDEIARVLQQLDGRAASSPQLRDVPTNELLLHEYAREPGLSLNSRRSYARTAALFERQIAPKSFLDASIDDVRAWERGLLDACKHHETTSLNGRGRAALERHKCVKGLFDWSLAPPTSCATSCPFFQRQREGPRGRLKGLRNFYAWLRDRGLIALNPVDGVARRHAKSLGKALGPLKYAPSVAEVRELLAAAARVGSPRDVAFLLLLAKTGRRPQHLLLVEAADLRGVMPGAPGPAWIDYRGVRARMEARNVGGHTKLQGNLIAPLDQESVAFLREIYLPWRQRQHGYAWTEGPLIPGDRTGDALRADAARGLALDPALDELAAHNPAWRAHAAGGPEPLTLGSFRHFFTTELETLGVSREDRMTLRGDVVPGALEAYRHLDAQKVCQKYRAPTLL
ncbi:MAG: hypothetical protein ACYDCK_01550 [Thermoplasmatota archaeon]